MNNKKHVLFICVNVIFAAIVMVFDYLFLSSYLAKADKAVYVTYKIIASVLGIGVALITKI